MSKSDEGRTWDDEMGDDPCPRCGEPHKGEGLEFGEMDRPISRGVKGKITHYVMCPKTEDPVVLVQFKAYSFGRSTELDQRWPSGSTLGVRASGSPGNVQYPDNLPMAV